MPELVSPAGSAEAVSAAVQSGADAVYMSVGYGPNEISENDFARAADFCRVRGVKVYVDIGASPFDEDMTKAVDKARRAARYGADAVILHDLGLIWAVRRAIPDLRVHAGVRLDIHNLEGVLLAAAMGVKRVALDGGLEMEALRELVINSPVELEIPVHGPLCPVGGGACFLPASVGGENADREYCTGLCREVFQRDTARRGAPFDTDELCLATHMLEIRDMGVPAIRIEGRERRPEYVAAVTGVYARLLAAWARPSASDAAILRSAHEVAAFTDGTFGGGKRRIRGGPGVADKEAFYLALRRDYLNHEYQRVRVRFTGRVAKGEPFRLVATDDRGFEAEATGAIPILAFHQETDTGTLSTELMKTGGTPFLCGDVAVDIDRGLYLTPKDIAGPRDAVLRSLLKQRTAFDMYGEEAVELPPRAAGLTEPPVLTVSLQRCSQLSKRLLELAPPVIYLPMAELLSGSAELEPFLKSEEISLCAAVPASMHDKELEGLTEELEKLKAIGVRELLVGSMGHMRTLRKRGFDIRGDVTVNIRNSLSIHVMRAFGLKSLALSPELGPARVRAISKPIPSELVVYGRLPLMTTDDCIIKNVLGNCSCDSLPSITDRDGFVHPVTHDAGCRTTVWSARKLFLAGRSREYMSAGLWGVRLMFTTESAGECVTVTERYLGLSEFEPAMYFTELGVQPS